MEGERKIKRAKERKKRGETGGEVPSSSPPVSPRFFPALSLALFFARPPLSERLEQAIVPLSIGAERPVPKEGEDLKPQQRIV